MEEDIRWKQRFENYKKSLKLLVDLAAKPQLSQAEQAALIHYYEMTFELGWKTLKDMLEGDGVIFRHNPRPTIMEAWRAGLILDGHAWIDALEERNKTAHTYEESKALEVENKIRASYIAIFKKLEDDFDAM